MGEEIVRYPEYWKSLEEAPVKEMPADLPKMTAYVPFRKTKSSLVQIEASNADILHRIKCYQASKREEVNWENIVEFCHASHQRHGQTCARADSVVTKRSDCKSHVKVRRVVNEWGPQLDIPEPGSQVKTEPAAAVDCACGNQGQGASIFPPAPIDERLYNAELHLKVDCPVPSDIYSRLKRIEERILSLEGMSPEYADINADRARLTDGNDIDYIPNNKKRYSKYELRRRLAMLKNNQVGKKLKSEHAEKTLKIHKAKEKE